MNAVTVLLQENFRIFYYLQVAGTYLPFDGCLWLIYGLMT